MLIVVRKEQKKDYRLVEEMARDAFWNLYIPGAHEHYMIHKMRSHPDFISDLALVVEVDGAVQGAVYYTKSKVITNDGSYIDTITLGPVFVSEDYQGKKLAKILISHSIKIAKQMGVSAIITQGYPYHYETFGFMSGKRYGISTADGKFYLGTLVLPLYEGALENKSGFIEFSDAMDVTEEQVEKFDKSFEMKQKSHQPSQDEFNAMVERLDI